MKMVYEFRSGARVPHGVTPDGITEERDRIENDYGKATIENSVEAVLAHPDKYPNLLAFCPADSEAAMRQGTAEGIRLAYRTVVIRRSEPEAKPQPRQIRVIHSVKDTDGDLVYKPLQVIAESSAEEKYLMRQLRLDAESFASKMSDVLAEIEELHRITRKG
jgi:hypothetical protein